MEPITKVVFRKWPNGEVLALFPEEANDLQRDYFCTSYAPVGQHCAANPFIVMQSTRPAQPEEYADLKQELESEPYNYRLEVRQRITRQMHEARQRQFQELRDRPLDK